MIRCTFSRGSPVARLTASRMAVANLRFYSSVRPMRMSMVSIAIVVFLA